MAILDTAVDPGSAVYAAGRQAMLDRLAELETALDAARAGGGERSVTRHHARGKLLPRERVELLIDRDSPLLELSPVAAWGTDYPVGAGVVTGIGVVAGVECVLIANDPTVRGGALNPYTLHKINRAGEIALENRLPVITLIEAGGADPAAVRLTPALGGAVLRDLAKLSVARIPTVSVVLGDATADSAYIPGVSGFTIMVRHRARLLPAATAPAPTAAGEDVDGTRSGLADFVAEDERDGIRLARQCVRRLNWCKHGPPPRTVSPAGPRHDPEDLLSMAWTGLRAPDGSQARDEPQTRDEPQALFDPPARGHRPVPFDPREVLARILDGSEFDEFKPGHGDALVTGWGELHGYPVGVLANSGEPLRGREARKATQFIRLANTADTPLVFLQYAAGFASGVEEGRPGDVGDSAMMINAVANSGVPHLTVVMGPARGAGGYALCGRSLRPRFLFAWPDVAVAAEVTPPPGASPAGPPPSGGLSDDGVIDPRDTRDVLGVCLSAIHSAPYTGATDFGAFR